MARPVAMLKSAQRYDYVSPQFKTIRLDDYFPNMITGDPSTCPWPHMRRNTPHTWYRDRRVDGVGFLNRDEAHILYNTALRFAGAHALEIGCFLGWSACHLAAAGVKLDVVDPLLSNPEVLKSVRESLAGAGLLSQVMLHSVESPHAVTVLGRDGKRRWSLLFIDGDHEFPGPMRDAVVCERYACADAAIVFHDVIAPAVAEAVYFLRDRGWNVRLYHTAQIMAVAWRGAVEPVDHVPDPDAAWPIPDHLRDLAHGME
jgi:predicted O-methyltransferase YrrM